MKTKFISMISIIVCTGIVGWMMFDGSYRENIVLGQLSQTIPSPVDPSGLSTLTPPVPNSCDEPIYFCQADCGSPDYDCLGFCNLGDDIGDSCSYSTGGTVYSGTCVGICELTMLPQVLWTSCTDDSHCSITGDTCIGYQSPTTIATGTGSGVQCQEDLDGCGPLHMTTGDNQTILTGGTSGLCTSGFALTGSVEFVVDQGYRVWRCENDPANPVPNSEDISVCWLIVEDAGSGTGGTSGGGTSGGTGSGNRGGTQTSITSGSIIPKPPSNQTPGSLPVVRKNFSEALRASIARFESSCAYTDSDYREIMFEDILRNPHHEAIKTLQAYCIVKGYTRTHNTQFHADAATSIGEAIKILTKIVAMDEGVSFNEFGWYPGQLPYGDMLPNARYTPYVIYAHQRGYLDGLVGSKLFGRSDLKALTPITKRQFSRLLSNFGKDPREYRILSLPGSFVMRSDMSAIIVDAFAEDLADYRFLYGNNVTFYRWILERLEEQENHAGYIKSLIATMKERNADMMGWRHNIHVEGMIEFLEQLLKR